MATGEFPALTGLEIEQIWVWKSYLRLVFDLGAPNQLGVYIDLTDFQFKDAANNWEVRVDDDPLTAGPVLGLLNQRVTTAQVCDWELALTFEQHRITRRQSQSQGSCHQTMSRSPEPCATGIHGGLGTWVNGCGK
nr:hypothetical protein [Nocardia amamiensis]